MLLTLAILLVIAWLLGLVAFHVTAWFIHVLIVIAIIAAILHFVRGGSRVWRDDPPSRGLALAPVFSR